MWHLVGIVRDEERLRMARSRVETALWRRESRGCHFRSDRRDRDNRYHAVSHRQTRPRV